MVGMDGSLAKWLVLSRQGDGCCIEVQVTKLWNNRPARNENDFKAVVPKEYYLVYVPQRLEKTRGVFENGEREERDVIKEMNQKRARKAREEEYE